MDPELARFLAEELDILPEGPRAWQVTTAIWLWRPKDKPSSSTAWHFITITGAAADGLRAAAPGRAAAWGSVYVTVTLGASTWQTSAFPSKDAGGYLLPIKAEVRKREAVGEGDVVTVSIAV